MGSPNTYTVNTELETQTAEISNSKAVDVKQSQGFLEKIMNESKIVQQTIQGRKVVTENAELDTKRLESEYCDYKKILNDIEQKLEKTELDKVRLTRNIDDIRKSVNEKRKKARVEGEDRNELRKKVAILSPLMPGFFDKKRAGVGEYGEDKENCGPG